MEFPSLRSVATPVGVDPHRPLVSRGRSVFVHFSLLTFALVILVKAAQVQLIERERWGALAERQQIRDEPLVPQRGRILDGTGRVLVETRELTRVTLTPHELRVRQGLGNTRQTVREGLKALRVPNDIIRRAMDTSRMWVELPQLYAPDQVARFAGIPGVKREAVYRRDLAASPGLRVLVGSVDNTDAARGGIEQSFDSLLRGVVGHRAKLRDGRGSAVGTPDFLDVNAQAGHSVMLTINKSLQEIAERELKTAMQSTGATGGDVVIVDARDGAVLALTGARDGVAAITSTPLTQAYEAGSVMKPFLVARLLQEGRATADEMVNTEGGTAIFAKHLMTDEHKAAQMPVRDVIRFSSNIGTAKLAQRWSPREEYQILRDFGFGTFTGLPYPGESRGQLRLPGKWIPLSQTQIAIGYEVTATPMQIAMAYVALANGGELLQAQLVRQIVDARGAPVYTMQRQVLRRVLSAHAAREMQTMLESVVDSGTAVDAQLETFKVAGKSGTAKVNEGGRYIDGRFNASFAGMFPAQHPQFVLVARLMDPVGTYYGGVVAGKLVNGILRAAVATPDVAFDRSALAREAKPLPLPKPTTEQALTSVARDSARFDSLRAPAPPRAAPMPVAVNVEVELPLRATGATTPTPWRQDTVMTVEPLLMPSVVGLDLRQAVRTLHDAGLRVKIVPGKTWQTRPQAGAPVRVGMTVVLESSR